MCHERWALHVVIKRKFFLHLFITTMAYDDTTGCSLVSLMKKYTHNSDTAVNTQQLHVWPARSYGRGSTWRRWTVSAQQLPSWLPGHQQEQRDHQSPTILCLPHTSKTHIVHIQCDTKNCTVFLQQLRQNFIYYDNFRHTYTSVNFLSPVGSIFFIQSEMGNQLKF